MTNTCNKCENEATRNRIITFTEWSYEAQEAHHERQIKRLWVALLVVISMLFASNVGWLIYQSQFETIEYSQDSEGINNVNYGEQGDQNNGAASTNPKEESDRPKTEGIEGS